MKKCSLRFSDRITRFIFCEISDDVKTEENLFRSMTSRDAEVAQSHWHNMWRSIPKKMLCRYEKPSSWFISTRNGDHGFWTLRNAKSNSSDLRLSLPLYDVMSSRVNILWFVINRLLTIFENSSIADRCKMSHFFHYYIETQLRVSSWSLKLCQNAISIWTLYFMLTRYQYVQRGCVRQFFQSVDIF